MQIVQRAVVLAIVATVTACATVAIYAQPETQRVNAYGAAVKAFRDRADAYLAVQKKAAEGVPPLKETSDPTKLTAREQALGEAIRQARAGAKPGDIFGAELSTHIRNVVRKDWAKRSAADKAGLIHDVPPGYLADVNSTYSQTCLWGRFPRRCLRPCRRYPRISNTGSSDVT